jgi:uncharacterized glyoxalase superfamily protein PhnB
MSQDLTPYLCCADAAAAIGFYTTVFGAVQVQRWTARDGRIGHAELELAGQRLYVADEHRRSAYEGRGRSVARRCRWCSPCRTPTRL